MSSKFAPILSGTLAADIATSGTLALTFPTGYDKGDFINGGPHEFFVNGTKYSSPKDFTIALDTSATTFTITYLGSSTLPAGSSYRVGLRMPFSSDNRPWDQLKNSKRIGIAPLWQINLGAADTADADGICASQSVSSGVAASLDGALVSNGVAVFDVPRNVVGAWTTAAVITIVGYDDFGNLMYEKSASGTSHTGSKAFKRVISVTPSASITGATFGSGNKLGLPAAIRNVNEVVDELENGYSIKPAGRVFLPFEIEQTELLAGTAENIVCPVDGYIDQARGIVQGAVTTGGGITFEVNTTTVVGLGFTIADADAAGVRYSDRPTTPRSSTTVVAKGDRLTVTPAAAIDTAGQLNGVIEIETAGLQGTLAVAAHTANSYTSGDVRGTYTPRTTPDGVTAYSLIVRLADPNLTAPAQYTP